MSFGPHHLDPALFGVLAAAVEEESAAAYEAGFSDGLREASFRISTEDDDEEPSDGMFLP